MWSIHRWAGLYLESVKIASTRWKQEDKNENGCCIKRSFLHHPSCTVCIPYELERSFFFLIPPRGPASAWAHHYFTPSKMVRLSFLCTKLGVCVCGLRVVGFIWLCSFAAFVRGACYGHAREQISLVLSRAMRQRVVVHLQHFNCICMEPVKFFIILPHQRAHCVR